MFEIEQVRRLGAHGHTILDIGANIGTTSIPRIHQGHFLRAVVAEPSQVDFRCLVRNIVTNELRGHILPERSAIYSRTGTVRFVEAAQSGVHRVSGKDKGDEVPSFRLDDWLDRREITPALVDFVKCDAQGAEGHILEGAEALLARRRAIWQIEYWPKGLTAPGTTESALQDLLHRWFSHFILLGRRGDGQEDLTAYPLTALADAMASLELGPRGFTNLLLYPTTRAAIRGSVST
ncbi:MAG: hypothetical protein CL441_06305 [Acidimicrobiaceae bacterium]|nr:hypothetical protein [Acidimicrobiaceae bacterium]